MKIKDQEAWDKWVKNNQDPYGKGIIEYAERWADMMEATILTSSETIADCAKRLSHEADTEGITGFMYGAAVTVLATTWEYGEELRRWHNLDTQLGDEGEKANESGGVLNPALINVSPKKK